MILFVKLLFGFRKSLLILNNESGKEHITHEVEELQKLHFGFGKGFIIVY